MREEIIIHRFISRFAALTAFIIFISATLAAAQKSNLELGIRYLKLGNSYREAQDFDKAIEFIEKGRNLVQQKSPYWNAVSKEYYGFFYRDLGRSKENNEEKALFLKEAVSSFKEALNSYRKVIKQRDGSPVAVEALLKNIDNLEREIQELGAESSSKYGGSSEVLNYDKQKLKQVPPTIPTNVHNLSLAENRFNDFPSQLISFRNLRYLNLSKNRIKSISSGINALNELHYLDLSGNRLKSVPNEIAGLRKLNELNLADNRLKDLPPGICDLKDLKILNLRNNKIPFEKISNIIKCLPNTNIIFDEYILKAEKIK